jgi:Kelch motif
MRTFTEYPSYLGNVFFSGVSQMSERKGRTKGWAIGLAIVMVTSMALGMVPVALAYSPTWDILNPMDLERSQAVTVIDSANDTVYIISGALDLNVSSGGNLENVTNSVTAYGVVNGTSWHVAPIPIGVRGACGGIGIDGRIYVFAGYNDSLGMWIATTQIYDIASNSWGTGANIPFSTFEAKCAVIWPNIYVVAGALTPTKVQIYNALTDSWSPGAALPTGMYGGGMAYVKSVDSIFYIGGNGCPADSTVLRYRVSLDNWTTVAPLPSAVTSLEATTGADGLVYAVGGSISPAPGDTPVYAKGYYYCANNDTWFSLPSMNYARKYLGLVSYEDRILAFGGNDGGSTLNCVESLTIFVANPSFSATSIGQGGEAWLNLSMDAFATTKGTAFAYYLKSTLGVVYPAETQIFAAGNASVLIEIPQSMPVGTYELHAYFGTTFETGSYTFPEAIFPFSVFATTSLQQQISDLQNQITQLEGLINEINSSLSSQLNDTMANITQLQLQLAQMNANLTLFVNQIQTQIDQLNKSLVNETTQLQLALDQAKADLANAIGLVNASLSAQLNDTLNEVDALQVQNTLLQNQITQLQNKLNDLEDQMATNDQALMDKLNLTSDQMNQVNGGFNDLNGTVTNSIGSLSTNMMIGLLGLLVALLVAILVVFMSLSRKIKDIELQQASKGADESTGLDETKPKMRTVKQKSPEEQVPPPPAPPEEKL